MCVLLLQVRKILISDPCDSRNLSFILHLQVIQTLTSSLTTFQVIILINDLTSNWTTLRWSWKSQEKWSWKSTHASTAERRRWSWKIQEKCQEKWSRKSTHASPAENIAVSPVSSAILAKTGATFDAQKLASTPLNGFGLGGIASSANNTTTLRWTTIRRTTIRWATIRWTTIIWTTLYRLVLLVLILVQDLRRSSRVDKEHAITPLIGDTTWLDTK